MQELISHSRHIELNTVKGRCYSLVSGRFAFLALVLLLFWACWIRVMITD